MDRKRYEQLHREYRELQKVYYSLMDNSKNDMNASTRRLIIMRQGEILSKTGGCYCKNYDYLDDGGREYMGKRNRMTGHPTPKLKGI